jgi:hypothetical protein
MIPWVLTLYCANATEWQKRSHQIPGNYTPENRSQEWWEPSTPIFHTANEIWNLNPDTVSTDIQAPCFTQDPPSNKHFKLQPKCSEDQIPGHSRLLSLLFLTALKIHGRALHGSRGSWAPDSRLHPPVWVEALVIWNLVWFNWEELKPSLIKLDQSESGFISFRLKTVRASPFSIGSPGTCTVAMEATWHFVPASCW